MSVVKPFPVQGPVRPEARQIGRRPAIDSLHRQLVECEQHTVLLDERRVGKTSMALAVLDRVRDAGSGWAIETDLSRGITSSGELADRLAEQARTARIRIEGQQEAGRRGARAAVAFGGSPLAKIVAKLLGVDEVADAVEMAAAVDQMLAPLDEGAPDLRVVLHGIQAAAMATSRPVFVFLDEIQRVITHWDDAADSRYAQEALAEMMEWHDGRLVLLLAGSERSAVEQLLAEGQPLHHDGMLFEVPPINDADWHHDLPGRFREAGLQVTHEHIDRILDASGGHPQRTMRICAHLQQLADGVTVDVTTTSIDQAIRIAREHPSWPS